MLDYNGLHTVDNTCPDDEDVEVRKLTVGRHLKTDMFSEHRSRRLADNGKIN